jgi:phosphoglycolate phosphatase
MRLFVERADQVMAGMTTIYPYAADAVAALRAAGLRLGIVTTKYRYRLEQSIPPAMRAAFDVIVGYEDVPQPKPDPAGLLLALERTGSDAEHALYVGDSVTDAETARRASAPFVAVLSGATPAAAFREYAPYAILPRVAELPAMLRRTQGETEARQEEPTNGHR